MDVVIITKVAQSVQHLLPHMREDADAKAAFTRAQHVARQQVARTSNMLRATSNMFKQHVARNMLSATCCAGVNAA